LFIFSTAAETDELLSASSPLSGTETFKTRFDADSDFSSRQNLVLGCDKSMCLISSASVFDSSNPQIRQQRFKNCGKNNGVLWA
jgi:hypothetical protein